MTDISKSASLSLSAIYPRGSQAESVVALAREAGGLSRPVEIDGVGIRVDRVAVATSARFSEQVSTLRQAASNAAAAASVLDVADTALTKISGKLDRLEELADIAARTGIENDDGTTYTPPELSNQERAVLQDEFAEVKSEIDSFASSASFNGTNLLQGDPGAPASPLEMSFQTGGNAADGVTVSLNDARVSALSSDLDSTSLLTQAGSDTAVTAVAEAKVAVDDIKASVRGARAQIANVSAAAGEVSAIVGEVRDAKVSPEAVLELSRLVSDQAVREGGVEMIDGAQQVLQSVLLRAASVSTSGGAPASGSDGVEAFGGKTSGAPSAAPPAAAADTSSSSNGSDDH